MDFLTLVVVYCVVFVVGCLCILYRDAKILTTGPVGMLRNTLVEYLTNMIPSPILRGLSVTVHYLLFERNCVFQLIFLVLALLAHAVFLIDMLPILHHYYPDKNHTFWPFVALFLNYICFHKAWVGDPGVITAKTLGKYKSVYEYDGAMYMKSHCRTCNIARPARSKHCSACNRCVHRFDHHCIWTNNCVGGLNHHYFILFMVTLVAMFLQGIYVGTDCVLIYAERIRLWEASYEGKDGQIHPMTASVAFQICGKGCVESGNLKKHMQTHTKEKPFICDICGKTYGRRSLLDNHYRLHTGELPYKCDFKGCDKAFRSYGNLKQHKANHVQDHSFICDICGKTFKLKSRMNHHRKSHIIEHRWPCDYCEMKFKSIFMYKNHLAKIHPLMKKDIEERTNIRLYQCEICQKMYGDKEDLTRHIYIHNGLKPFKCSYCGKGFNDKSNMKCHERIHTGEKKLNCRFCYKTFLQPRALRQHLKNVHGKDEEEQDEKHEVLPRTKVENSYRVENVYKSEGFNVDQECQAAVENVLNVESGPSLLLDMRTVSQAVITEPSHAALVQTYPTHTLEQPAHLFPQLVKEFEPLMIVENY